MLAIEAPLVRAQWRLGVGRSSLCEREAPVARLKQTLTHRAGGEGEGGREGGREWVSEINTASESELDMVGVRRNVYSTN